MITTARKIVMTFAAAIALLVSSSAAQAQITVEVGDSSSGWIGFMNVSNLPVPDGDGVFQFGSPWGVSDLVAEFDDPNGVLTLKPNSIGDPDPYWYIGGGAPGNPGNKIMEANLFQEFTIAPVDVGMSLTFEGTVLTNTFTSAHVAEIFIKEFTPDFLTLVNTTTTPLTPGAFSISQNMSTAGNVCQYGFVVNGVNVWITDIAPFGMATIESAVSMGDPTPPLGTFCSDFEELVPDSLFTSLGGGWQFFHNQPMGGDYFGDAPQGPQISNLADQSGDPGNTLFQENGGDDGSNQYLNIYSDYDNAQRMGNPLFDFVNNVFQEQTFTGADAALEQTYTFSFDYAGGQTPFSVSENVDSTAAAFIRVLDNGGGLLDEAFFDTSGVAPTVAGASPVIVWSHGKVSITMNPKWVKGGTIQFGFTTTTSLFEPCGVFYDNVCFGVLGDANNDGEFNNLDIGSYVLALVDAIAYAGMFPEVDPDGILDMNCDGIFDNLDTAAFVAALVGP